eukprot:909782-Pyramimonas_sp.AAC.1
MRTSAETLKPAVAEVVSERMPPLCSKRWCLRTPSVGMWSNYRLKSPAIKRRALNTVTCVA